MTISEGETRTSSVTLTENNSTVINNGIIAIPSMSSDEGVTVIGDNVTITNNGTITVDNSGNAGIFSNGDNTTITNSGTITAVGISGTQGLTGAVITLGDNAIITNSGTITATGNSGVAIYAVGDNAIITNSGTITATGTDSYAVRGSDAGDQRLILTPGHIISGRVDLGTREDDDDVIEIQGSAVYDRTQATGVERYDLTTVVDMGGNGGDVIIALDPTGSSATRITLGVTTGRIHRQVFERLASVRGESANKGAWGNFFGGGIKRGSDGRAQAWKHNFYGGVGGFDTRLPSGQRVGVFAGGGRGQIRASGPSIRDGASRAFFGAYGQQALVRNTRGKLTLDGSVLFGYARHDSTREVTDHIAGQLEAANGGYNSFYISPSLALTYVHQLDGGFELRPGAQIAYTYGHFGAYTENGTTRSNMSFEGRGVSIVDGRMQMALARTFADDRGEIELRAGAIITQYSNSNAGARLDGRPMITYRLPGGDVVYGSYTGVRLNYAVNDYTTLGGDFEYARRSGRGNSVQGYLRLAVRF